MKKNFFLLLLLLAFHNHSFSQDQHLVDSLETQLKNHNAHKLELGKNFPVMNDTVAAWTLNDLAWAYINSNPDTAIELARQSLALSEQLGWKRGKANAWNNMGAVNQNQGNYAAALEFYKKALETRKEMGNRNGVAFSLQFIASANEAQGNYAEALENYLASLKISEQTGNKVFQANNLYGIGNINKRQGNYEDALKHVRAAVEIYEETEAKINVGRGNDLIGSIYTAQGNYQAALNNLLAGLKTWEEVGDKMGIANSYNEIGYVYIKQGNYAEALKYHSDALKIAEETGDKFNMGYAYNNIGEIYLKQKKYPQSTEYYNKALLLAKEINNADAISQVNRDMSKVDSASGNFKGALEHYKQYISFRDSVWSNENTKKMTQQQMQFDFDKKQVADSLNFAKEKELAAVKLQKQKAITYGGFAGIAVTVILLFFVYRNYNKQRIANQKLKEAQDQLIKSEKMAAFGMMASRVSHEIQNPLNFVNNFSDLAEEMVHDIVKSNSEQAREETAKDLINNLQKIKHHGKRADTIVRQLQEHTNKGTAHEYFES